MTKNNYKRILPQLFDVRPMKNSVDLDWEAIKIVEKILDLKNAMTKQEVHIRRESLILRRSPSSTTSWLRGKQNIRDLRENESAVFIRDNKNDYQKKPVKVRSFFEEDEDIYSQLLSDDYFAAINERSPILFNGELPLTQKDALHEFENIDARDTRIEERREISERFESSPSLPSSPSSPSLPSSSSYQVYQVESLPTLPSYQVYQVESLPTLPSYQFVSRTPSLFSKIRFTNLIILVFAAFSLFSAVFFWNKTNNSGELISASSYRSIAVNSETPFLVETDGERQTPFPVRKDNIGDFFSFLGKYGREYLLIFQNSAEMRATGGVTEFYGIFQPKADQPRAGKMENETPADFSVSEILDLDAKLTENIIPPRPLQKISTGWSMHDANWFPDFPLSARQLSSFYKKISNETVDGVISFNSAFIADILTITGPIKLDNYKEEIGADNAASFLAQKTDNLKFLLKEEKNFFPYFARLLLNKISLLDKTGQGKIAAVLSDNLNKRNIQAFFNDAEAEKIILSNNWGGEMQAMPTGRQASDKDFLSVINSSVDGYKNDGNITETINHKSEIQPDGSIIDAVHIIKNYQNKNLDNKLFNLMDYNYLRVYVPFGSELLEAEGLSKEDYYPPIDYEKNNFKNDVQVSEIEQGLPAGRQGARFHESGAEVFNESGKTVFGGWVYVAPGRSISIKYKYKLPFKISKNSLPAGQAGDYSLTVRKQSGSINSEFAGTIELPDNFIVKDKSDNLREESGIYKISDNLEEDLEYGIFFE